MTPSDDRRDLPPEQDAVRRLLADARHDEPVPPAVAARLDAVLAELSADRRDAPAPAPVVDLGARRRRWVGPALAAAAAVVVAGVGIGQLVDGTVSSDSGAGAGSSAAGGAGADEEAAERPKELSQESDSDAQRERAQQDVTASAAVPPVSSVTLRRDLRAALVSARALDATASGPSALGVACPPADDSLVGQGRQVAVTLDDRPALALYRAPEGDRRKVDVYLCGTGVPAETVTIRAR